MRCMVESWQPIVWLKTVQGDLLSQSQAIDQWLQTASQCIFADPIQMQCGQPPGDHPERLQQRRLVFDPVNARHMQQPPWWSRRSSLSSLEGSCVDAQG